MARVLLVGCGCRGSALGAQLVESGHAVRGTSRTAPPGPPIEGVIADPARLATLTPHLDGVTVVCWLMGTADDPELHGARLETILEWIVDTPARAFVYEAAGPLDPELYARGARAVARAAETWHIQAEAVGVDPVDREAWLAAVAAAVDAVLAR